MFEYIVWIEEPNGVKQMKCVIIVFFFICILIISLIGSFIAKDFLNTLLDLIKVKRAKN